ncbi:Zinc finger CCCH-type [Penicillium taxi]|uniref:Zinc finger CCCH-type n=1 Tax=Penicillium taxi TaxID=168475 RepID=UPI0025459611|nr:Zinc finger CCCH-type [Penicillium taxi]KAJ5898917.1 Zinc finger CCCH-type [Penicillium taxi]
MRPSHFVERPSGEKIPLVAVDELPRTIKIQDIQEVLSASDTQGMVSCGVAPRRSETWAIDTTNFQPELEQELAALLVSMIADTSVPIGYRSKIQQLLHHGVNVSSIVAPCTKVAVSNLATSRNFAVSIMPNVHRPDQPRAGRTQRSQKEYCSYWMRHGECDYHQQGCVFKHEMPETMEQMNTLGLREIPRWYRDLHGLPSLNSDRGPEYALSMLADVQRELREEKALNSALVPTITDPYPTSTTNLIAPYTPIPNAVVPYSSAVTQRATDSRYGNNSRYNIWRAGASKSRGSKSTSSDSGSLAINTSFGNAHNVVRRSTSSNGSILAASSAPFIPSSRSSCESLADSHTGSQTGSHADSQTQTGSQTASQTTSQGPSSRENLSAQSVSRNVWGFGPPQVQHADSSRCDTINRQLGTPPVSGNSDSGRSTRSSNSRFWDANGSFKSYDGSYSPPRSKGKGVPNNTVAYSNALRLLTRDGWKRVSTFGKDIESERVQSIGVGHQYRYLPDEGLTSRDFLLNFGPVGGDDEILKYEAEIKATSEYQYFDLYHSEVVNGPIDDHLTCHCCK